MARVYTKAQTVLIWLGEASDQSDIAMEFFPIFVEQVRRNNEVATSKKSTQTPFEIIERGGSLAAALKHLFERPWFGRVWTLQEVALAARSEIWCGPKSFDFRVMETFARGCDNDKRGHWITALELIGPALDSPDPENPPRPHDAHIHIINKLKRRTTGSASMLNSLRHLDCSQDEDRICSVLRLLDAGLLDEITPDHKPSVAALYCCAALYGIRRGELDHLGAAGLSQHRVRYPARQRSSNEPFLTLPSWVPDWTYKIRTHSYWVHSRDHEVRHRVPLFFAGGSARPAHEWHFSEDRKTLSATGIVIDGVEDCAPPFHLLQIPDGVAEGPIEDQINLICKAQNELQLYIVSCMNLAKRCVSKYGSTNVGRACRQSLVGGMMPEGTTTTKGFETFIWIANETNSLATLAKAALGTSNGELMKDMMARHAKVTSARERLGDVSKANNLISAVADACKGRRFFVTSRHHYMGVAPDLTEPGDKICVLNGCCAPFVIRPKGNAYQLVGECFVAGVMDGEIMESKGHLSKPILLE